MNNSILVTLVTLAGALLTGAAAVWCLASPATFADFVEFPRHEHFVHDLGAFQLGLTAVPLMHRLGRARTGRTVHFELTPAAR